MRSKVSRGRNLIFEVVEADAGPELEAGGEIDYDGRFKIRAGTIELGRLLVPLRTVGFAEKSKSNPIADQRADGSASNARVAFYFFVVVGDKSEAEAGFCNVEICICPKEKTFSLRFSSRLLLLTTTSTTTFFDNP